MPTNRRCQRQNERMSDGELWDLTDAQGNLHGATHQRGAPGWPAGAFHVVAGVCVVRDDGLVLLTLRSAIKDYPLMWEFPAGSALAGETSIQAAERELREETGLAALPESMRLVGRFTEATALFDFYVTKSRDAAELDVDNDEVDDAEWVTLDEVARRWDADLMAGPWAPRLVEFWPRLVELVAQVGRI